MISVYQAIGAGITASVLCLLLGFALGRRTRYTHYLRYEVGEISQTFQARSLEELQRIAKETKS